MNKLYEYLYWKKRAMLMGAGGTNAWWLAPGMNEEDCLAAYDFKGAESRAGANIDLTGHEHTLSEVTFENPQTIGWTAGVGYQWSNDNRGQLKSQTKIMATALACIFKFSQADGANNQFVAFGGGNGDSTYTSVNFNFIFFNSGAEVQQLGLSIFEWSEVDGFIMPTVYQNPTHLISAGVVGLNARANKVYINGNRESMTELYVNAYTIGSNGLIGGHGGTSFNKGEYVLEKLAFYRRQLSQAEHQYIGQGISG